MGTLEPSAGGLGWPHPPSAAPRAIATTDPRPCTHRRSMWCARIRRSTRDPHPPAAGSSPTQRPFPRKSMLTHRYRTYAQKGIIIIIIWKPNKYDVLYLFTCSCVNIPVLCMCRLRYVSWWFLFSGDRACRGLHTHSTVRAANSVSGVFTLDLPSFIFTMRHRCICNVLLNSILLFYTKSACIFNKCAITYFVPTAFIYGSRSTTEYLKILNFRLLCSDLVLQIILQLIYFF